MTVTDLTDDALYAADNEDELSAAPPEDDGAAAAGPPSDDDLGPDESAPYGYMRDRRTGEKRPKKSAGRPKVRDADELAAAPPVQAEPDQPPAAPLKGWAAAAARFQSRQPPPAPPAPLDEVPMPKGGIIAKKVDRLYRRAGKIVRIKNEDLGNAFIECTHPDPDDEDALTVGQAWENLARDNPRIRAWLVNLIKGGDWQDLVWAHAPIGIAIVTSTWVGRILPLGRLAEAFLEPDEDEDEDEQEAGPRMQPADAEQMMQVAQAQAQKIAAKMGAKVPAHVAEQAWREAERQATRLGVLTPPYSQHDLPPDEVSDPAGAAAAAAGNGSVPPAYRRAQQPKRTTRSQRRH